MTATTSCTDTIAPGDSAYDNAHAAEDIERLRSTWDVPTLALLGIGNGAQVALAYAGSHPDKVARLVLDSPLPLAIAAEAAVEQRVKGEQAALDAFAAQCAATNCPLGAGPKGRDRRTCWRQRGRAAGQAARRWRRWPMRSRTALAFPRGDRVTSANDLAAAVAAARSGDTNPIDQPDHPGRVAAPDRRAVRQRLQRRAEPADARPGPRARGRVAQAVPAVRRGRRARTWSSA